MNNCSFLWQIVEYAKHCVIELGVVDSAEQIKSNSHRVRFFWPSAFSASSACLLVTKLTLICAIYCKFSLL